MGQNFLLFCHRMPSLLQQSQLVDLVGGGERREMELDSGDRIEEKDG
jgi:hypothetical protein